MFIAPNNIAPNRLFGPPAQIGQSASSAAFMLGMMQGMLQLMSMVMALSSGGNAFSGGPAAFGGGSGGAFGGAGPSPASFLGTSPGASAPAGASNGASGPAEVGGSSAGGGWIKPVDNYRVSSRFGPRRSPTAGASTNHRGIDLAAPLNTPVRAAKAGVISVSKNQASGYGQWLEIRHEDGTRSRYAHLNSRDVQVGARVQAGQVIGKMGSTGTSTGSHLHFEILNSQGQQINPESAMRL